MWTYILLFAFVNMVLGLCVAILWIRSIRPAKDDPRLTRGLQLLQSKIAVLEDLSDRTDKQVQQLVHILEERTRILQGKLLQAEETVRRIDQSITKSLDVAEIFQDKIPHEEIIERKNTSKYVQAAKLAHEGLSVDEIARRTNIPRSEVEFIAKVNRDQLMFEPENLPAWVKTDEAELDFEETRLEAQTFEKAFTPQVPDLSSLQKIQGEFKAAVDERARDEQLATERAQALEEKQKQLIESARQMTTNMSNKMSSAMTAAKTTAQSAANGVAAATVAATAAATAKARAATAPVAKSVAQAAGEILTAKDPEKPIIRKVQFPRIDSDLP